MSAPGCRAIREEWGGERYGAARPREQGRGLSFSLAPITGSVVSASEQP